MHDFLSRNVQKYRSSSWLVFYEKGVLKNFAKFTGKHPVSGNFIKKGTLAHVFSCKFYETFKNTYFNLTPLAATSGSSLRFSILVII